MTVIPAPRSQRKPGSVVLVAAVAVMGVGVLLAVLGLWKWGVWVIAASLVACSVARVSLSDHAAGWLRVRRKALDVLATALLAVGIIVIFLSLPPRR